MARNTHDFDLETDMKEKIFFHLSYFIFSPVGAAKNRLNI